MGKTNARRMIYIEVSYCPTSEKHREGTLIIILRLTLMDKRRVSAKANIKGARSIDSSDGFLSYLFPSFHANLG